MTTTTKPAATAPKVSSTLKGRLIDVIEHEARALIPLSERRNNAGKLLSEVFLWQTLASHAEKELKKAWKVCQDEKLVPTDDVLRETICAEIVIAESPMFSCTAKVTTARETLDEETLVAVMMKRLKITIDKARAIVDGSKKTGAAPLTKRVLEVS